MSEFLNQIEAKNVLEVESGAIEDAYEQKAVLAMQATALYVMGRSEAEQANEKLLQSSRLIDTAPTMTYEDLIFKNPLDLYAYTVSADEGVAKQEIQFYLGHRYIEQELATVIKALIEGDLNMAKAAMHRAVRRFGGLYRQISAEAFGQFRSYFVGLNGYPGPSGLFTASIPIIDLLVHGGVNIGEKERNRVLTDVNRGLYPSHQSEHLRELLLVNNPSLDLPEEARTVIKTSLNTFRNVHERSVHKLIPTASNVDAEGSGGVVDIAAYLASKLVKIERSLE